MDKDLDKQIIDAFRESQQWWRRMQVKMEAKWWTEITPNITLDVVLARLTKDDLAHLRQTLNIKNISHLRKAELITELSTAIPSMIPQLCCQMDEARVKLLCEIMDHAGCMPVPDISAHQIRYYLNRGLLFPGTVTGKRVLIMPVEIRNSLSNMDWTYHEVYIKKNTEWLNLTRGMLRFYGTMELTVLAKKLEYYTGVRVDTFQLISLLHDSLDYYIDYKWTPHGWSFYRNQSPELVISNQQARDEIDYYPFTYQQLVTAAQVDLIDRNPAYMNFVRYLFDNYVIPWDEADQMVGECLYGILNGKWPSDILDYLQYHLEISSLENAQEIIQQVIDLWNHSPHWILKGYTPAELRQAFNPDMIQVPRKKAEIYDFKSCKKVGRNDPCPCGSGKKYKKCCGVTVLE